MKEKKQVRVKWKSILILILCFVVGLCFFLFLGKEVGYEDGYLKGEGARIEALSEDGSILDYLIRGTKIEYKKESKIEKEGSIYYQIKYNDNIYYVKEDNITEDINDLIMEQTKYVRTTYHLLGKELNGTLLDLMKKGSEVEITGYHKIEEDGTVDYYELKVGDTQGYFPSKYLVDTKELAEKPYDEAGIYQIHAGRGNVYGGGSATSADYYPVVKPTFEDNKMPTEVYALYLNGSKPVLQNVEKYIALAKQSKINAFVVDIKDSGSPCYQSEVMKEYSKTNYEHAQQTMEEYKEAIQKLKEEGYYVIGRISVFKDNFYAIDHPEEAIRNTKTNEPYYLAKSYWPSAYSRNVWKFNVDLAKEAVTEMGFNEIQFDYVRFPDRVISLERQGLIDFRNTYEEEKIEAVQRFLMYATDELHKLNVYVSADVFGESAHTYVTAYGQYLPAISNVVDVVSAMPYPDHFSTYEYGFKEPVWTKPYEILNYWGKNYAMKRQEETPSPAIMRTWIEAYDTIHAPYIVYGENEVANEIQGLYDAGLTGGYMTWNSASSLSKYQSQINAYNKEYKK